MLRSAREILRTAALPSISIARNKAVCRGHGVSWVARGGRRDHRPHSALSFGSRERHTWRNVGSAATSHRYIHRADKAARAAAEKVRPLLVMRAVILLALSRTTG